MKSAKGKDIWLFGGPSLTAYLMGADMVDELWLSVHPIVLGEGKALFAGLRERVNFTLLENKPYDRGLVSLRYRVVHRDGS
jgi:dihydrofolate reductase